KEDRGRLLDYLVRHYAAEVPPVAPARVAPGRALALPQAAGKPAAPGDATKGAALYQALCANCHGPEALGADLGTNLVEKPVLLDPADYTAAVRDGRRRMPGFKLLLNPKAEADILAWL